MPENFTDELQKILAERENNYDHPWPNFERISKFDEILKEVPEGPEKVALRNICQKIARLMYALIATEHRAPTESEWASIKDSILDISGYAQCCLKCAEYRRSLYKKE